MICNWKQQFDIQRFAEGGAAGGAAAAAGSAADAGQPGEGAGAGAQSAPNAAQTGQDATAGETPRDLKAEFDALTGNMAARTEATANQDSPNKAEAKTTTTDAVGGTLAGDSLAVQARRRAQNAADPNK